MSELIDRLALLARLRDGDALDLAVSKLALELIRCEGAAIHRVIDDEGTRRWLTTARVFAGSSTESAAAIGEPESWPRFEDRRSWCECLEDEEPKAIAGERVLTLFRIATGILAAGVIEITSPAALDAAQRRAITSLLGFHRQLRILIDENERDSLTGLLNRKSFDATFFRVANEAAADSACPDGMQERRDAIVAQQMWLGVVDIDFFKRINDQYGHLMGDEVLLLFARLLGKTLRHDDRLYRFGGEEFVILLRTPGEQAAARAFERLRRTVEQHVFPQVGRLTLCIGYTAVGRGDNPGAAFERADRAVYHAKQTGRNRVVAHADLVAALQSEPQHGAIELFHSPGVGKDTQEAAPALG